MRVMAMLRAITTIQPMVARRLGAIERALALAPMRVLAAAFCLGWREESKQGVMIFIRCILFLAICGGWHRIWLATDLSNVALAFSVSADSLTSYLLMAQWVVFVVSHRYRDVADLIQSGRGVQPAESSHPRIGRTAWPPPLAGWLG
jgi:hypothetical protein